MTLHIAAINDFHGGIYETKEANEPAMAVGGLPNLAWAIERLRADHPELILLGDGDLESSAASMCDPDGCTATAMLRSRQAESPSGDLVADAMLVAVDSPDLAVQNGSGLRADLPAGPIRVERLERPYGMRGRRHPTSQLENAQDQARPMLTSAHVPGNVPPHPGLHERV